jgi:pyrroline-5-carboxylate reductase
VNLPNICFIGGGNMARSIIGGLIAKGIAAQNITACDPQQETLTKLQADFGIKVSQDNAATVDAADVVVLAVKPQVMAKVCQDLAPHMSPGVLVVSIAAGISCTSLTSWLGERRAIVRCMPNTPSLVGEGATGLYANPKVTDAQRRETEAIMGAVGLVAWVEEEHLMDAVTAVSGSGPAYFFLAMEAMIDAGVQQGLSPETARTLTLQTALGAARLAQLSPDSVAELRRRVTSPGGTTEQAILSFENNNLREIYAEAMQACADRARAMANEFV